MSGTDLYVYPGTNVLKNRFGIRDAALLDRTEREWVTQRLMEGAPGGNFNLRHLQAIHHHLFQDVYDWAGQLRTVEISKSGDQFLFANRIELGMQDVHRKLVKGDFLRGLDLDAFAAAAAETIGDLNFVHPFREGNGRTQLEYLRQLGEQAGHELDLSRLPRTGWIEASKASHDGDYEPMRTAIRRTFSGGFPKP